MEWYWWMLFVVAVIALFVFIWRITKSPDELNEEFLKDDVWKKKGDDERDHY